MNIDDTTEHAAQIEFRAPISERHAEVLTPAAMGFLVALHRKFNRRRKNLLAGREVRQVRLDAGEKPDFIPETNTIRDADWTVAPLPPDLLDRRVEITGPTDRKMIINALNSGAKVFMADLEDSTTPTWSNMLDGQINLHDAVRRTITFEDPASRKQYKLNPQTAVLFVRPRGWHLEEKHVWLDGEPMSGSLFDFGLYAFHNAAELVRRGTGPYFYLPKMESHLEARLWNDIFVATETTLGISPGTFKGTVLIETILAAFEMDEILWELREHSAGLNCGRWDYIFSFIKKFAGDSSILLPDRSRVTMTTHFMRSYSKLAIKTCHRRGVSAMGGMSAFIPIKSDPAANELALSQVRVDKEREATDGHDGTWVAHPGLVPVAMEVFDRLMPQPNQIDKQLPDFAATAADLLHIPEGPITQAGLKQNAAVCLGYLEAWIRGIGCVPLFNLMEDAATAEISRSQLWQWVHHGAVLDDGGLVTADLCDEFIEAELQDASANADEVRLKSYRKAASLLRNLIRATPFPEFLTLSAYDSLIAEETAGS